MSAWHTGLSEYGQFGYIKRPIWGKAILLLGVDGRGPGIQFCPHGCKGLAEAEAPLLERNPTAQGANDEVIEYIHIEELARFDDGTGNRDVLV